MATKMYDQLLNLPFFQGVTKEQLTRILEMIPFEFRTYKKGEIISQCGDTCEGAVFLISGKLRLETPVFDRRVVIKQLFEAPHTFSLHHLFGADRTARSTMVAASNKTGVMILSKADFLSVLMSNEITLINTMNMLCTKAQKQNKAIDFSAETDPVLKLASWLLAFTERPAKECEAEASETDWCDMLNLDASAFWRCVATLEGLHLIESRHGTLKLLDRYGLKSLVNKKTAQKN